MSAICKLTILEADHHQLCFARSNAPLRPDNPSVRPPSPLPTLSPRRLTVSAPRPPPIQCPRQTKTTPRSPDSILPARSSKTVRLPRPSRQASRLLAPLLAMRYTLLIL
jgi:hypothetical protein